MAVEKGVTYVAKGSFLNSHVDGKSVTALENGPGTVQIRCHCCNDTLKIDSDNLR